MTTPIYANDPSDMVSTQQMLSMSGLEFMQGMLEGRLPAPPIARTLNYHLTHVSEGKVVFRGSPTFDSLNPMGTVHGGWYGTLLDSAMGCAVMTKVPKGSFYTTLEYKINILRSIPVGRVVDTTAIIDHAGRSTGVAHGEIVDVETGRIYATGSTTCIIITPTS